MKNKFNTNVFREDELVLVQQANPEDIKFIIKGATVWLNSGSPPFKVQAVKNGNAFVSDGKNDFVFPIECLTPECGGL